MHKLLLAILIVFAFNSKSYSDTIRLHVPKLEETAKQHLFYLELLKTALEETGHNVKFEISRLPQLRVKKYLREGDLSLYWMIESEARNNEFIPIKVGLTDGLIGKRILFIRQGDQHKYNQVKNLDDFRKLNLVGGMGKKWFDVDIWRANDLKYLEAPGNWKSIFEKIPNGRPYNYFSRGLNEILTESKDYPKLAIEENLVLIYDRDFRFYLSKSGPNAGAPYEAVINEALQKAKKSGLIKRLVNKYWGNNFKTLNYEKRTKLHLKTPK